jgi:hypothetical protein
VTTCGFRITSCERNESPGCEGWQATVELEGGAHTLGLSRLDGEDGWTVDSHFQGWLPVFVNGYGARYLATRQIVDRGLLSHLAERVGD